MLCANESGLGLMFLDWLACAAPFPHRQVLYYMDA
jgi:hypothetical protein